MGDYLSLGIISWPSLDGKVVIWSIVVGRRPPAAMVVAILDRFLDFGTVGIISDRFVIFWYSPLDFGPIWMILDRTAILDFGRFHQPHKNTKIATPWPLARHGRRPGNAPHARYCIQKVRDDSQVNINTATCDTCQAERLLSSVSLPTTVHEFIMSNAGTPSERPSS